MTFTFKLSMRLALMRAVLLPAAAATFVACELPGRRPTDPGSPNNVVVQVFTSPDSITLDPDETRQFLAFGRTQSGDSVPVAVRWSASGGTITTDGLYTAGPNFGTYQITATATTSSVQSSSTVKNRGALTEVFVTPATVSVSAGGTRQFFAYGRKRNGDSVSVNVSYTATGGGISAAGLYSAGQNAGSYRVIAVNGPTALADTAAVAISILPVASVTVAPATASVAVGQVVGLVATLRDANGNPLSGRVVTWASSAAAVATVDSSGVVTGVAVGGAMVSATSEGQSGAALVSVAAAPAPVASVAVSPATASVVAGQAVQLAATPKDASGNALSGRVVTWASSAPAVATVNGSGLVTGVAAGAATITAASEGQSGGAAITVTSAVINPAPVTDLAVASVTDTSVTLSFHQVDDGTGQAASYIVKYGVGTLTWSTGLAVTRGTCVTPVAGTTIGAASSCTVLGLTAATAYQFGIVAFRGDLNTNAVFGPLSNLASGTTAVIPPGAGGVLFESDWSTALGNDPVSALRDGGRWSWEADWGGGKIMSVVPGGPDGHNALRVVQRGGSFAAFIEKDNLVPPSTDFYVRYYMRNDDTSPSGDHVVVPDYQAYPNLTYMRKYSSSTGWRFVISMYGCSFIYPISHIGPAVELAHGAWYRIEYYVHFVNPTQIQVHVRVYDAAGTQILGDADFRQEDYGNQVWNGRSDWTLASLYASGFSYCVNPVALTMFAVGNNGNGGAVDTGLPWYYANLQIRSDRWPGP